MKDVNKVVLLGRLGADPVKRETKKGIAVTQFSVATSRPIFSRDAETGEAEETESQAETVADRPEEETQWHRIVTWGKQAEACAQYLKTGSPVFVEGSLKTRRYSAKDGSSKLSVEIHAENVSFVGYPPSRAMQAIG
ncbi:MAG: single-stranded DNA-binding protein [Bdellovibrionales bacterium]|nr:single-stranded DNA-binding protein [Bdellovibrionales bacterium]